MAVGRPVPAGAEYREPDGREPDRGSSLRDEVGLVVVVTLVGLALRLWRLGTWSFWPDEVFSLGTKSDGFTSGWLLRSLGTDLIKWTVGVLGASEWSARLAPALIGALTIPLLYVLVRRVMGRTGALATVTLLALSPWHIYWSQNARFYTLLFLFFNIGLLLFYLGVEEDRPWLLVAALGLFGLAARERLVALLGMPALVAYLVLIPLLRWPRPRGYTLRTLGPFFGLAAAAGAVALWPYVRDWQGWVTGFARINTTPAFLAAGTLYYVGVAAAMLAAGTVVLVWGERRRPVLLLALGATLPLGLLMAVSLVQYAANRYVFFTLFCWLALAGLGIEALAVRLRPGARRWAGLVLAVVLAAYGADLFQYYTIQNGNRDDWRGALLYVAAHGEPGDVVVSSDQDIVQYYLGDRFVYRSWPEAGAGETAGAEAGAEAGQVWYVEDMTVAERYPEPLAAMHEQATEVAEYDVRLPGRTYRMRVYVQGNPDPGKE